MGNILIPLDDTAANGDGSRSYSADGVTDVCFKASTEDFCGYCFPASDFTLSSQDCDLKQRYSALFPMQFMTLTYRQRGITVANVDDSEDKEFFLHKENGEIQLGWRYISVPDADNSFKVHFWVICHAPKWQEGLKSYRELFLSRNKLPGYCSTFSNAWHFKRYAFHQAHLPNNVFENGEYRLWDEIQKDMRNFGGIDVVQLFDWGYAPQAGRNGTIDPLREIKDMDQLDGQLQQARAAGCAILFYFDGYFVTKNSPLSQIFNEKDTIKDENQKPYYQLGEDNWVICPYNEEWRGFIVRNCIDAMLLLTVDGLYLDQTGYGIHYICFDKNHNHPCPSSQITGEKELLKELQSINAPIMIEYFPADTLLPLAAATLTDNSSLIVASRFVFPEVRQFRVITCDEPIGDNTIEINKAFFNGLGLWLDGDSAGNIWYSDRVKQKIQKHYAILKKYSNSFASAKAIPLADIKHPHVLANQFEADGLVVRTLFNPTDTVAEGYLLPAHGGSAWDEYRETEAETMQTDEGKFIYCKVEAFDVGCIVERL